MKKITLFGLIMINQCINLKKYCLIFFLFLTLKSNSQNIKLSNTAVIKLGKLEISSVELTKWGAGPDRLKATEVQNYLANHPEWRLPTADELLNMYEQRNDEYHRGKIDNLIPDLYLCYGLNNGAKIPDKYSNYSWYKQANSIFLWVNFNGGQLSQDYGNECYVRLVKTSNASISNISNNSSNNSTTNTKPLDEINCELSRKKYLEQNPDVAKAGMDAWNHYTTFGKREGRKWPACAENEINNNTIRSEDINCELARKKYLEQNPDVAKAGMDAWNHYTSYGKREGRKWPACSENAKNNIQELRENDQTSLLNKCEIDGKLFYNDAVKYIGDCVGDKANGWGTLYLNNGNRLFGNFRENKLQDNFIEWFFANEGNTIIGPNKGSSLHGPCININSNNSTGIANYDNGKYIASNGYFLQEAPKFVYNETFNVADGDDVKLNGKLIPGTNNVIFTSKREYNSKGNWKCWITLLSLENNKIIFNYGSYEKPIISETDNKPELPNFISFSADKLSAYYDIKGHRDDLPKYLKCNLQNGGLEILNKLPVSISNIIDVEKILNERYFDKYEAIGYGFINNVKYKYVLLSDSSYLKAFNNSIYSKSIDNFRPVYGSGAKLVYFSKNHDVLKSIDFDGVTIYDFAVDTNSDRIALSYKSKDSTFLSYFNLTSLDKISDIFRKGNISPGTVKFSNTGTYLLCNDLLFLGNKLYFAIPGGRLYDFNEKENTALINGEGALRAYDIEHRRILWEFNIGDNYINTGFFKVANDFVIISGRVLSWEGYKPKENGIKIYRFNIPEPNLSLTEYKKNPDFLKQFATIDVAEKKPKSEVLESVKQDEKKLEKSKSDELVDMFSSYLLHYLVSEILNPSSPSYSSNSRSNSSASSNSQSSSSKTNANPNAYQCSSCMFLSMGNDEPLAYENGGCNYLSFGKIEHGSHNWLPVNSNCEVLGNRNTIHYDNSVCGLQCRRCGQKTFILSITPPFGGSCPNAIGNGADAHDWKEF